MSAVSTRDQCMLGVNERFVTEKSCVCLCACRTCARCRAIKREASTNARLMTRICRSCGDALSAEAQAEHRARVCCAHQAEHIVRLARNMRVQLAFGVALGLDEDRKAHGFEAYLGETIQECIDRSKASSGKVTLHVDQPGRVGDAGLRYASEDSVTVCPQESVGICRVFRMERQEH